MFKAFLFSLALVFSSNNIFAYKDPERKVEIDYTTSIMPFSEEVQEVINDVKAKIIFILKGQERLGLDVLSSSAYKNAITEIDNGNLDHVFGYLIREDEQGSNIKRLKIILKTKKIDINKPIPYSFTPIHFSIYFANFPLFKFLIQQGASINTQNLDELYFKFQLCKENLKKDHAETQNIDKEILHNIKHISRYIIDNMLEKLSFLDGVKAINIFNEWANLQQTQKIPSKL